jgi:hypothetical protein
MKTFLRVSLCAILMAVTLHSQAHAQDPLETWNWRNPLPQNFNPTSRLGFGNGNFIAMGDGWVYQSPDGVNWEGRNSNMQASLFNDVQFIDGQFIAVGVSGGIITSPDGWNWQSANSPTDRNINAVWGENGVDVAVADFGTALTSLDGVHWKQTNSNAGFDLLSLSYASGLFFAGGQDGCLFTSPDGQSWTDLDYPTGWYYPISMLATDGTTVATEVTGTTVWSTNDGYNVNEVYVGTTIPGNPIIYKSGRTLKYRFETIETFHLSSTTTQLSETNVSHIKTGGGAWMVSGTSDGFNWAEGSFSPLAWTGTSYQWESPREQPVYLPLAHQTLTSLAFGNETFVAAGTDNGINTFWTSLDGISWNNSQGKPPEQSDGSQVQYDNEGAATYQNLRGATAGNQTLVAVGDQGEIVTASWTPVTALYGILWTERVHGNSQRGNLKAVAYGNQMMLAVGDGVFARSTDEVDWSFGGFANYSSVAFGNGTFAAVGPGGVGLTPDGVNWSTNPNITVYGATQNTVTPTAIAFGNNQFVAAGPGTITTTSSAGSVVTPVTMATYSTNGTGWKSATIVKGPQLTINAMTWFNNQYIAAASDSNLYTSPNGITWTKHPEPHGITFQCFSPGPGVLGAVGISSPWGGGALFSSTDGVNFTQRDSIEALPPLYSIAYGYGSFFAVGNQGGILQCDTLKGIGPTATTGSSSATSTTVSGTTVTTGTFYGMVNPNGKQTYATFVYWEQEGSVAGPRISTGYVMLPASNGNLPVAISFAVPSTNSNPNYNYRIQAANVEGQRQGAILNTNPTPPSKLFSSGSATGLEGGNFLYQIKADNIPTSFTAQGLPTGLTLDPNTGIISGIPTESGTFNVIITCTNYAGPSPGLPFTLVVNAPPRPYIFSALSETLALGQGLSYQIEATNYPTSFQATNLPAGLSFQASGLITGTVTTSGTFFSTISAINSSGTDTEPFQILVLPVPPTAPASLQTTGTLGQPLQYNWGALVANFPNYFVATGLPPGLSIDTSTGIISGTPTQGGVFQVGLAASNSGGTGTSNLQMSIFASLSQTSGTYGGLLWNNSNAPALAKAVISPIGAVTGSITTEQGTFKFTGKLSAYGSFQATGGGLQTSLNVNVLPTSLNGNFTLTTKGLSQSWQGTLAVLGAAGATNGTYTVALPPPNPPISGVPQGYGSATMTVSPSGVVALSGWLGDGTAFKAQSQTRADQSGFDLLIPVYKGSQAGSVAGTVFFSTTANYDATGTVLWHKSGNFSATVGINTARYAPPAMTGPATLTATGGDLGNFSSSVNIATTGKATSPTKGLSLTITPASGIWKATIPNAITKKSDTSYGVIYQKPTMTGVGVFIGSGKNGAVTITQ